MIGFVPSHREQNFDPIETGMVDFGEYPRGSRYGLIDAFTSADPQEFDAASAQYVKDMAHTVLLVATSAEAQRSEPGKRSIILVSPALAARGIHAVVSNEHRKRVAVMEARSEGALKQQGKRAKKSFGGFVIKGGALERLAELQFDGERPFDEDSYMTEVRRKQLIPDSSSIVRSLENQGIDLLHRAEEATLSVIEGIVMPDEFATERAAYLQSAAKDWQSAA